ncbi:MAG: hypothetical protein M1582_02375, partial [Actinobacteria bacterium]|nr:hypothetical protein [Actinomycetota bacterium]
RDPQAIRHMLALVAGISPEECDREETVAVYEFVLRESWIDMEALVGKMGARAIVEHSVGRAARERPAVGLVAVTENGPDISPLLAQYQAGAEACRCLLELCTVVFLTMIQLTGEVIAAPLLEKIARERGTDAGTGWRP